MASVFTKICGLRETRHIDAAIDGGADAVGFVLSPSPRFIEPAAVLPLVEHVAGRALTVAVFRDEPVERILPLVRESGVAAIQVHGERTREEIAALAATGLPVIRAVPGADAAGPSLGEQFLLVDAPRPGSGQVWDYSAMAGLGIGRPWLLAGGLTPGNVADAIRVSGAWGVDVSSGVETAPGRKSSALIRAFLAAARGAGLEHAPEERTE